MSLYETLSMLDKPRQATWNFGEGIADMISGDFDVNDFFAMLPGAFGGYAGAASGMLGAGIPASILLGSLVGGGLQSLPFAREAKTPDQLISSLGGDPESTAGTLGAFGLAVATDPLSFAIPGGISAGRRGAAGLAERFGSKLDDAIPANPFYAEPGITYADDIIERSPFYSEQPFTNPRTMLDQGSIIKPPGFVPQNVRGYSGYGLSDEGMIPSQSMMPSPGMIPEGYGVRPPPMPRTSTPSWENAAFNRRTDPFVNPRLGVSPYGLAEENLEAMKSLDLYGPPATGPLGRSQATPLPTPIPFAQPPMIPDELLPRGNPLGGMGIGGPSTMPPRQPIGYRTIGDPMTGTYIPEDLLGALQAANIALPRSMQGLELMGARNQAFGMLDPAMARLSGGGDLAEQLARAQIGQDVGSSLNQSLFAFAPDMFGGGSPLAALANQTPEQLNLIMMAARNDPNLMAQMAKVQAELLPQGTKRIEQFFGVPETQVRPMFQADMANAGMDAAAGGFNLDRELMRDALTQQQLIPISQMFERGYANVGSVLDQNAATRMGPDLFKRAGARPPGIAPGASNAPIASVPSPMPISPGGGRIVSPNLKRDLLSNGRTFQSKEQVDMMMQELAMQAQQTGMPLSALIERLMGNRALGGPGGIPQTDELMRMMQMMGIG